MVEPNDSLIAELRKEAVKSPDGVKFLALDDIEQIIRQHRAAQLDYKPAMTHADEALDSIQFSKDTDITRKTDTLKISSKTYKIEPIESDTLIETIKRNLLINLPLAQATDEEYTHCAEIIAKAVKHNKPSEMLLPFDKECFHLTWEDNLSYDEGGYQDNHDRLEKFVSYYESCKAMKAAKSPVRESGTLTEEAKAVIRCAQVFIYADIMVTPNMSRADAVKSGYAALNRAIDLYDASQPASCALQCSSNQIEGEK